MDRSDEFQNLINRIRPGQSARYYENLYDDTLEFTNNNVNGEDPYEND